MINEDFGNAAKKDLKGFYYVKLVGVSSDLHNVILVDPKSKILYIRIENEFWGKNTNHLIETQLGWEVSVGSFKQGEFTRQKCVNNKYIVHIENSLVKFVYCINREFAFLKELNILVIKKFLKQNRKIDAIVSHRLYSGDGLKESKDFVEWVQNGR